MNSYFQGNTVLFKINFHQYVLFIKIGENTPKLKLIAKAYCIKI